MPLEFESKYSCLLLTQGTTLQTQKDACDKHDPEFYPKYKKWCDDYFLIKVTNVERGCVVSLLCDISFHLQQQYMPRVLKSSAFKFVTLFLLIETLFMG